MFKRHMFIYKSITFLVLGIVATTSSFAQQVADSAFTYQVETPAYALGTGPVVTVDEAHFNFHTINGRYYPFAKLLAQDGYQLRPGTETFAKRTLKDTEILVIANALPHNGPWILPTDPAFTKDEVQVVKEWVKDGGSLFLIADHMPFPGAAEVLAGAFGFEFVNGFAMKKDGSAEIFTRDIGNLKASPVTDGRNASEKIDQISIFTGQGFVAPPEAYTFLLLDTSYTILSPQRAWEFDDTTPSRSGERHAAGACMTYGKGKIVVMGEAAMFTAQLAGPQRQKVGMNHRDASQNPQLLLNIVHWLGKDE